MWLKIVLIVLAVIIIGLVSIVLISKSRFDSNHARLVDELIAETSQQPDRIFKKDDLEGLPEPVQKYLSSVLTEGQPYVKTVRLQQKGEFRLGDTVAPWKPLTATQHFTVHPPGFIWSAKIEMFSLMTVRVVDMYKQGKGALYAKILSTIPVVELGETPEMNSGELMRYLAETVWFPTALLPGEGINWDPIDDQSARAIVNHHGTSVSLVFHFNNRNEVVRVFAKNRYREVDGKFEQTPWTGHFSNYQERNGMRIPIEGIVEWHLPEGDFSYWRGHLEEIEHSLAK